ncbi:B_lectin domain-containing protein [Cephalotus follicularis]|uniref:B_lectin domain-containing protein n=1 Tax=Cephalotus follicularis TaxID=3775 RepID=A0A1Q3DGR8_CEPFO|nr:B_lectin domain-containing protein [Cephalotus follicularis]
MKLYFFSCLIVLFTQGYCNSEIHAGYRVTVAVPIEYNPGFIGRAFLMEGSQIEPNFKAALSVEAINGKYSCSLEVFLGDVKVWNSGHYWKFYTSKKCVIELTGDGDLQLKGLKERVGWRTGTSAQGVEKLQILRTGNMVLTDALDSIKWQSFNFPTDVILWGQRLDVATRLTSFPSNLSSFYSFEIQPDKIALYVNSDHIGKTSASEIFGIGE